MHGEYRHLREHANLGKNNGINSIIATNGDVVEIQANSRVSIIDRVHTGRIFVDGTFLVAEDEGVISDRVKLMNNGIAMISVVLTEKKPFFDFELSLLGVPMFDDTKIRLTAQLEEDLDTFIQTKKVTSIERINNEIIESECRRSVNKFFKAELGKKPQIQLCIHRRNH